MACVSCTASYRRVPRTITPVHEVGDAGLVRCLEQRAAAHHERGTHDADGWILADQHDQTVRQDATGDLGRGRLAGRRDSEEDQRQGQASHRAGGRRATRT